MLKSEMSTLIASQRARISQLETQIASGAAPKSTVALAVGRLVARHPTRRSFTAAEVHAERAAS